MAIRLLLICRPPFRASEGIILPTNRQRKCAPPAFIEERYRSFFIGHLHVSVSEPNIDKSSQAKFHILYLQRDGHTLLSQLTAVDENIATTSVAINTIYDILIWRIDSCVHSKTKYQQDQEYNLCEQDPFVQLKAGSRLGHHVHLAIPRTRRSPKRRDRAAPLWRAGSSLERV